LETAYCLLFSVSIIIILSPFLHACEKVGQDVIC